MSDPSYRIKRMAIPSGIYSVSGPKIGCHTQLQFIDMLVFVLSMNYHVKHQLYEVLEQVNLGSEAQYFIAGTFGLSSSVLMVTIVSS